MKIIQLLLIQNVQININKSCIEIGFRSVYYLFLHGININKSCIEIENSKRRDYYGILININKSCIEIGYCWQQRI